MLLGFAVASLVIAGGCDISGDNGSTEKRGTSTTTSRSIVEGVPLATPALGFRKDCESAAMSLGFAVPCPTRLPLVHGKSVHCSPCISMAGGGESLDRIFFLNIEGFDPEPSPQAVHHMIVEDRGIDRAPPSPCFGGVSAGTTRVAQWQVAFLDCPPRTLETERQVMHGEGAHSEHILGYWDENGVRYAVSVHGITGANRSVLQRVIASIEIVEP